MTDNRELAKPVEELARAHVREAGADQVAGPDWEKAVAYYRRRVQINPDYAARSHHLVATAFRQARTSIDTLRALGMISEFGLEAIKAEEREA